MSITSVANQINDYSKPKLRLSTQEIGVRHHVPSFFHRRNGGTWCL